MEGSRRTPRPWSPGGGSVATLTGVYENTKGLIVQLVFRCEAADDVPTTGVETRTLRWVTHEKVIELADEAYAIRVLDALDAQVGSHPLMPC
ncbi:hypothetical protein GCM10010360_57450 [Streptomyces nogalater]